MADICIQTNNNHMTTKIKWRTVGNMMTTTIKVMVEGKKRYLRFRVEDQEVISNLHLESKVLFNHLWFGMDVLQGKESVEAFLSKLDLTTGDGIEIIKSPNNPGHFILAFDGLHTEPRPFGDGNSAEYPQDRVLYHLHRMARKIVNNHKW